MTPTTKHTPQGQFIFSMLITAVFIPALILLLAGNWLWLEGWIFALWFDVMILFNGLYLYWKDPALLAERSKLPGSDNQKPWDNCHLCHRVSVVCDPALGRSMIVLVGRIIGEERMLINELEGYDAYRQKVRYRLVPYIW